MDPQPHPVQPDPAQPGPLPKTGMSTGAKVGIGCGSGCLVLILLGVIAGFAGWKWVEGKVKEFEAEFAEIGLAPGPSGQVLQVTEVPTEPTFYKAQVVTLNFSEPVTVEIGVIAQQLDIQKGSFAENVYFRGQIVTVQPGADLEKELNVICQMVQNLGGKVAGGITGRYQAKQ